MNSELTQDVGIKPQTPSALKLRSIITCNIGVCLEGFDFIAYSAFSFIIAKLYFPSDDSLTSILFAFGSLGIAYLIRPFAGIFWGIYADRYGRKLALSWISIIMAIGTAMIAFVPTHQTIGIAAPIIMILARLIQGFAASGEFASATSMLVELAPANRRSFYASTQMATQVATVGLAVLAVLLLSEYLTQAALESWGWRSIFVLGTLVGPLGFYMRSHMDESPEFLAYSQRKKQTRNTPLSDTFRRYKSELICMAGLIVIATSSFYFILIFMPIYAARELGIPMVDTQISTIICTLIQAVFILIAGRLADKVGRIQILLPTAILYALVAYPLFSYLITHPTFYALLIVQAIASVISGFLSGPLPSAISELLPSDVRSSGIGFIYNIVGAIFGGLSPFIVTLIVGVTGNPAGPAYWATFTGLIGAIAVVAIYRRRTNITIN